MVNFASNHPKTFALATVAASNPHTTIDLVKNTVDASKNLMRGEGKSEAESVILDNDQLRDNIECAPSMV